MEQDDAIDSLLCETPSLLPTLSLSLSSSQGPPPAPEGPAVAPPVTPAPAQTSVSSHNQGKGLLKVSAQSEDQEVSADLFHCFCNFLSYFSLCHQIKEENIIPQIKLEPHEVDQFLNLSPKGQNLNFSLSLYQLSDATLTPAGHLLS